MTICMQLSEKNFADWHDHVLGYGYGSGEEYWIPALHKFFTELLEDDHSYDYTVLEAEFGGLAAWLLINTLCQPTAVIEYGVSPRFGWLTDVGRSIRGFVASHTQEQLATIVQEHTDTCYPDWCNCTLSPNPCNPLWQTKTEQTVRR